MKPERGHGRRLTGAEYDRQVVALYEGQPEGLSKQSQEQLRRRELELAIDFRLGVDFPSQRRTELWAIQQRIERRWLRMALAHFFRRPLARRAHGLAAWLVAEYATVLSPEEMLHFFGEAELENPSLPLDSE